MLSVGVSTLCSNFVTIMLMLDGKNITIMLERNYRYAPLYLSFFCDYIVCCFEGRDVL